MWISAGCHGSSAPRRHCWFGGTDRSARASRAVHSEGERTLSRMRAWRPACSGRGEAAKEIGCAVMGRESGAGVVRKSGERGMGRDV